MVEAFGIVEPFGNVGGIEDHRRRDHRPGQRTATGLVHACHRPQAFGHRLRLEGEVGLLDDFEKKRRIGTRASHVAARFASAPILRKSLRVEWGAGPGGHRLQAGGQGRTGFFLLHRPTKAGAAICLQSSINCSVALAAATNWSVLSVRRSALRPSRLAAISKRRPICQA